MLIVTFHNDGTGNIFTGNYDYVVYLNKEILDKGRIEEHDRLLGWQELVKRLADKAINEAYQKDIEPLMEFYEKRDKEKDETE